MSLPEVLLWQQLRAGRLDGLRFRRQHPIGRIVLDFYCPHLRLCIEVDGGAHDFLSRAEDDLRRDAWLTEQGIRVLRIPASAILGDEFDSVLRMIVETARG